MEKKRPIGVTIMGWFSLIMGLLSIPSVIAALKRGYFTIFVSLVLILISVALGIGLLKLKKIAWNCFIIIVILCNLWIVFSVYSVLTNTSNNLPMDKRLILSIAYIPLFLIGILLIIYFTRPKVKEQFK